MTRLIKIAGFTLFAVSALAVTGCNTVQGVGQDIESAGEAIDRAGKKYE